MPPTTNEEIVAVCREWQRRLNLQDWDIELKLCRHWEIDYTTNAEIHIWPEKKKARLAIIAHYDYPPAPQNWTPYDAEYLIVHELCHLYFKPFTRQDVDYLRIAEEQAVNAFTAALLEGFRARPDWVTKPPQEEPS